LPYERLRTVVHPSSVVHAFVQYRDGASIAHLGYPDMRVPISYALTFPSRAPTPCESLDFSRELALEFFPPDEEAFPCLALARVAGQAGGGAPCVLNAANEIAVAAFLDGALPFLGISETVERTLARVDAPEVRDLDELLELDSEAREAALASTRKLVA